MKRAVVTGIVCALLMAGVAWATQFLRDNQNLNGFSFTDPTHAGSGPLCAQYDNTGKLTSAGAPCSSGGGAVSSVTGTALRVSALPTTGAVVIDTIGGFYSGATSAGNQDLGALTSGVDQITVSGGVASMATYAATPGDVQYGAASGGGLAQSANLFWNNSSTRLGVGTNAPKVTFHAVLGGTGTMAFPYETGVFESNTDIKLGVYSSGASIASGTTSSVTLGTSTATNAAGRLPGFEFQNVPGATAAATLVRYNYLERDPTTGVVTVAAADLFDLFGDGTITVPVKSASSTPSGGRASVYVDSTSKNLAAKNDAGTVNHGAQTQSSVSGVALTGLADNGSWTTQSFTAPGTAVTCGQLPAFTGAITSAGATCATSYAGMPTAGQIDISAGTTAAPVGDTNFTYNTSTHAFTSAGQNFLGSLTGVAFLNSGAVQTTAIGTGLLLTGFTLSVNLSGLVRTTNLPYSFQFLGGVGVVSNVWATSGGNNVTNGGGTSTSPIEYGVGFVAKIVRIVVAIQSGGNSLTGAGIIYAVSRNGSVVGSVTVPPSSGTTLFDSGDVSVAGASTDTFGMRYGPSGTITGGTIAANVNVEVFQ